MRNAVGLIVKLSPFVLLMTARSWFGPLCLPLLSGCVIVFIYSAAAVHTRKISRIEVDQTSQTIWAQRITELVITEECPTLHLASLVRGEVGARREAYAIKTLLHFRRHPLVIHFITDVTAHHILKTLFDSWQLPEVVVSYHLLDTDGEELKSAVYRLHVIQKSLPQTVQGMVLVFSDSTRFLHDPSPLWSEIINQHNLDWDIAWGNIHPSLINEKDKDFIYDVVMLNFDSIRSSNLTDPLMTSEAWLDKTSVVHFGTQWNFPVSPKSATQSQPSIIPKIVHWGGEAQQYTESQWMETLKERVTGLANSDGDLLRWERTCTVVTAPPPAASEKPSDCQEYINAANDKRRIHLNFYGNSQDNQRAAGDVDITLASQFTMDRIGMFFRMVDLWSGPLLGIVHATDYETSKLQEAVKQSRNMQKRSNIVLHVVYRRKFYPINMLRNLAINQTMTSHILFDDVDLLPMPGLYQLLLNELKSNPQRNNKTLLTVPAFEAFGPLDPFPNNKSELVKMWDKDQLGGYRMKRGWNKGHKATNYPKWKTANASYIVKWEKSFEPYVVMPTTGAPHYHERLLERMGDKIAYGLQLSALGYDFLIVYNAFIVHLPHPVSEGTSYWSSNRKYFRCGGTLMKEYEKSLQH